MDANCGLSVNLSQLPSSTTPLHIVLWKGVDTASPTITSTTSVTSLGGPVAPLNLETNETIKRLLDRITVLESMVSGLLETQKSSIWFSPGLRPTPTGIEVISRRESMGAECDIGTVLSQLVRPSDTPAVTIAPSSSLARGATGPEPAEAEEATDGLEEAEAEEAEAEEAEATHGLEEAEGEGEEAEAEGEGEAEEANEAEATDELEEEVVEYKEVQWKGQTYYVDGEQQAYEMDSDGDLIDTPVGVWREATQKLVRYKAP